MTKKKRASGKYILSILLIILGVGGFFGVRYYQQWLSPNVIKSGKLFIPTGATYQQVLDSIRPFLKNEKSFNVVAQKRNYSRRIYAGRYSIGQNETNRALLQKLSQGLQDEIAIRIGNYASIFELAEKLGPLLETDSQEIVEAIVNADFAKGYDTAALISFFFPDTYHFHWNTSAPEFVTKMKRQYDKYWTIERVAEAGSKNMTPLQVTTLASIVQLESAKVDEQPRVAGLYLNRLKIGMKLDADPTVIFAMRKAEGFTRKIHRVYYKNLSFESPYNTYKYKGLPPSPICMPNQSALNAVLNPAEHKYIFFVADPAKPGYHVYAQTLKEQEENAKKYRNWANENNVQ